MKQLSGSNLACQECGVVWCGVVLPCGGFRAEGSVCCVVGLRCYMTRRMLSAMGWVTLTGRAVPPPPFYDPQLLCPYSPTAVVFSPFYDPQLFCLHSPPPPLSTTLSCHARAPLLPPPLHGPQLLCFPPSVVPIIPPLPPFP